MDFTNAYRKRSFLLIGFFFRCLFFSVSSFPSLLFRLFLLHLFFTVSLFTAFFPAALFLLRFSCRFPFAAFPLPLFPCRFSLAAFPLLRFLCCVSLAAFPLLCFPCCVSLAASLCLPVHYVRQRLNNIFIVSGIMKSKLSCFAPNKISVIIFLMAFFTR